QRRGRRRSTLFPYTTLFRSIDGERHALSPQVYRFLSVLAQGGGDPVHKRTIADALEIDVDKCKGADICKRHKAVYRTFVAHDKRSEEHTSELQSRENVVCRP